MQGATDADHPFALGAGVPQGCPLSAVVFVLTAHPLLGLFKRTIPELECHMATQTTWRRYWHAQKPSYDFQPSSMLGTGPLA